MDSVNALILAAGEGTRLRPLTLTCPKPMLYVGDAPLLAYLLRWLRGQDVMDVAINLHYQPRVITEYVGDGGRFGVKATYSVENPILGSAGAMRRLQWYLRSTFLVVYGDMLLDLDLAPLLELHRHSGAQMTMGLMRTDDPASKGIAELGGDGRVLRFVEKPVPGEIDGDLASAGVYIIQSAALEMVQPNACSDIGRDLVPRLLRDGRPVFGSLLDGYLLDIGTHESYRTAQDDVARLGRYWEPQLHA